jgi:hypothetical protein
LKRAVVDQPGFKIIFIGLVCSLILGLLIKNEISPKKIKFKLDKTISKLEPDLKIDFKSIEIKLTDWGWPQPYLEVHDIRISPVKRICDESQIFIDTVSFPLTWNLIFESEKVIRSLHMNNLEIRLSKFTNCFSFDQEKSEEKVLKSALSQLFTAHNSGQLQDLKIDRIKLLSKSNYKTPLFLQTAVLRFSYQESTLSKIAINAQMSTNRDESRQIFKLRSDLVLNLEKNKSNEILIHGDIAGKIIDRPYQIKFDYENTSNRFIFEAKLNQIAINSLVKILGLEDDHVLSSINKYFSNYFVSMIATGGFDFYKNDFSEIQVENLILESQQSYLKTKKMVIEKLNPMQIQSGSEFDVFSFDLRHFIIENISKDYIQNHINHYGQFSGRIFWDTTDHILATGKISDFNFNLNYKSEKWLQVFNSMNVRYEVQNSTKDMLISKVVINQQPTEGYIRYSTDQKNVEKYSVQLRGPLLSSVISNEVFGVDQKLNLDLNFNNIQDEKSGLTVKSEGFMYQGAHFENIKLFSHDINSISTNYSITIGQAKWEENESITENNQKSLIDLLQSIHQRYRPIKAVEDVAIKTLKNIDMSVIVSEDAVKADVILKSNPQIRNRVGILMGQNIFQLEPSEVGP